MNPVDIKIYHPIVVSNEEAIQMYSQLTSDSNAKKTFRFITATQENDDVAPLAKSSFEIYNPQTNNRKLVVKNDVSNTVFENDALVSYWSNLLQSNNITDIKGVGKYSSKDDIFRIHREKTGRLQ